VVARPRREGFPRHRDFPDLRALVLALLTFVAALAYGAFGAYVAAPVEPQQTLSAPAPAPTYAPLVLGAPHATRRHPVETKELDL